MVAIVRLHIAIALMSLTTAVQADRLIHIPLGKKVPNHVFRFEGVVDQNDWKRMHGYLDAGLTPFIDATLRTEDLSAPNNRATVDIAYNYISPLMDTSPGLSAGVQDALNRTADGRRFYVASTFRVGLTGSGADTFTPAEVTIGGFAGAKSGAFVGVMLPLTAAFRLEAEHDGYRVNSGIDLRPLPNVAVKYLFIGSKPELSLQIQSKF